MSRGLVLVKWWLLALPHYLILSVKVGGGLWLSTGSTDVSDAGWGAGGLVGLFVLIAAVAVLFTGRHPGSLYGLILGMDRWSLRVTACAALITDVYPPFRLDLGGTEPGTIPAGPIPPQPPDERGPDPTNSTGAAANFLRCSGSSFSTLDPSPPFGPSMRRHRMARASSARPSPPAHRLRAGVMRL